MSASQAGPPGASWRCKTCTFINSNPFATKCDMCSYPREIKRQKHEQIHVCPLCGNDFDDANLLDEHLTMHALEEEEREIRNSPTVGSAGGEGFFDQYERSIQNAAASGRVSESWAKRKLEEVKSNPRGPDTDTRTQGITDALRNYFTSHPDPKRTFVLATNTDFFSASYGDRGWGCGYRNIQMLCSTLLQVAQFKPVLFDGLGYVPVVPCIQEFLEKAWSRGFDAEGAKQLGMSVFNTNRWIGTTECVTLLRSFGIRGEIVDFVSAPASPTAAGVGRGRGRGRGSGSSKQSTIEESLFGSSTSLSSVPLDSGSTKTRKYQPNKELFQWIVNYFERQSQRHERDGTPILPVYLQHSGHSRTIVGFERMGPNMNQVNLLIFDPSVWSRNIPDDISNGKLQKIRRTLQGFTHKEYQVAFVPTFDLLSAAEQDKAKTIFAYDRIEAK